ncbi:MAG: SDR family NAD(P)-dependent oxidoreductase [Clostridia bacterium]|nr:SDR family NAD(P)-dependent oxidoreductase [Clostridia bacterium]
MLITGGSAGIGLTLAKKFLQTGNRVIITGRDEAKLKQVKVSYPDLITELADSSQESDLQMLAEKYGDGLPTFLQGLGLSPNKAQPYIAPAKQDSDYEKGL